MAWTRKPTLHTRDLASQLGADWVPGTVTVRRAGDNVMVDVQALGRAEAGTGTVQIVTLPAGFRPAAHLYGTSFRGYRTRCLSSGVVAIDAPGASVDYLHFTFVTTDPKPTGGV